VPGATFEKEGLRDRKGTSRATLLVFAAAFCVLAIAASSSGLLQPFRREGKGGAAALVENAAGALGERGPAALPPDAGDGGCIHFMHRAFSEGGEGGQEEDALSPRYRDFMAKWQAMNPRRCIAKHGVPDVADLLESEGAFEWQGLLNSYKHYIQKCDVSRYMLMFFTGGVYTDLDVEVSQGLAEIERRYPNATVFLGTERVTPFAYADAMSALRIRNGTRERTTRVANYWMMSREPGHAFWLHVMALARERAPLPVAEIYDIIYTTGPDLLTEAYHTFEGEERDEIALLSPREFASLLKHHSDGSWKWHSNLSLLLLIGLHLFRKTLQGLSSACTLLVQVMVVLRLVRSPVRRTTKLRNWWWCLVIFSAMILL